MKYALLLTISLITSTVFSTEKPQQPKLTVCNDTARQVHILYTHDKSPKKYLLNCPDHIGVLPGKLRRLPHTQKNSATIGIEVDGKILRDYNQIPISDKSKSLIIHEYVPGIIAISQNGSIIAEVKVEKSLFAASR